MTGASLADRLGPATGHEGRERGRGWAAAGAVGLVRAYQGLTRHRLASCRYWPTCSAYAIAALEAHGLWRGGRLALRRLLRCGPWGGWGPDEVPDDLGDVRPPPQPSRRARGTG